jgi:beta-lactamase class A
VSDFVAQSHEFLSWAWVDPADGAEDHDGGEKVVPAASTIKLFVASAFWRSGLDPAEPVDEIPPAGSAGVAEYLSPEARLTLGDLALLMLAVSDNAATNVLLDRLGFDSVNGEVARLGLERTVVRRPMMTAGPENLTCALDLARGLARLAGEPRIIGALELALDSQLRYHLPADVRVAAKTGELDSVFHEVALLDDGRRRLVTAVCSSPPVTPDEVSQQGARLWHTLNNHRS